MNINIGQSWKNELKLEFNKTYFQRLINFLAEENKHYNILPKEHLIFKAFELCPFDKVKVVILGQDPYPTKGHANGLSFSVNDDVNPLPKSLKNIFKELADDLNKPERICGNLNDWAKQGVLLLNTTLTVREGEVESHINKGWEILTNSVISALHKKNNIVYILWGKKAQKMSHFINKNNNYIIYSSHPSPLSSYRGFFGSKPFSKTNQYLLIKGKTPIIWS
ncbi:MAG: uracil-DNA glycosylase [Crocinitomicaceae bacterium]|nr:uracil-DNA glycosylase [Crocinitomicaceae bacterium]|tara:strand:- start:2559 stop:3224 length:666 start_codon:yes stop_codon:yes gene_type:complete